MFIIRNIPEQKYFADIKNVTFTADSPDLSGFVTELAYYIWAMSKYIEFSTELLTYYSWHVFVRRYFSLSFYLISLKF